MQCGVSGEAEEFYDFEIVPGFSTPDWAKGAVMYQIIQTGFIMGIPLMMWRPESIIISAATAAG